MLATGWLAACSGSGPAIELAAPRLPGSTEVEQGSALYLDYGCILCHGPEGKGGVDNPNAETGGKIPGLAYVAEGYTARELSAKLLDGVPRIGKGDPAGPLPPLRMPGYRGLMTPGEKEALVAYLLSLYPEGQEQSWGEKKK